MPGWKRSEHPTILLLSLSRSRRGKWGTRKLSDLRRFQEPECSRKPASESSRRRAVAIGPGKSPERPGRQPQERLATWRQLASRELPPCAPWRSLRDCTGWRRPISRCGARRGGDEGASRLRRLGSRRLGRRRQLAQEARSARVPPPGRPQVRSARLGRAKPSQRCCRFRGPVNRSGSPWLVAHQCPTSRPKGGSTSRGETHVLVRGGGRHPPLRRGRAPAPPPATMSNARPKPAGNKLGLRAAGLEHAGGGGRAVSGQTVHRERGTTSKGKPKLVSVGGGPAALRRDRAPASLPATKASAALPSWALRRRRASSCGPLRHNDR